MCVCVCVCVCVFYSRYCLLLCCSFFYLFIFFFFFFFPEVQMVNKLYLPDNCQSQIFKPSKGMVEPVTCNEFTPFRLTLTPMF